MYMFILLFSLIFSQPCQYYFAKEKGGKYVTLPYLELGNELNMNLYVQKIGESKDSVTLNFQTVFEEELVEDRLNQKISIISVIEKKKPNYELNEKIKKGVYIKNRVITSDLLPNKAINLNFTKNEKFIVVKYSDFPIRVYSIKDLTGCK